MQRFEQVSQKISFPELERSVLGFWSEHDVFARSIALRKDDQLWVFYEGPPTANGTPGIHHVEARVFKDVYPRFKTMTGHLVPRKGGWDCHGLPVELEVEKEIGTTGKRDIEAFGIAEFNRLCRESVTRYVGEFERLTDRIGFWIDMSDAYWTMNTEYIESVWWSLKRLHDRGLLVEDDKVTAYCPRCGTALSDAEVALGYQTVEDPSVFVRFPIDRSPGGAFDGVSLLVWTTTPWTLPANLAVCFNPTLDYVAIDVGDEMVIVAARLADAFLAASGLAGSRIASPGHSSLGLLKILSSLSGCFSFSSFLTGSHQWRGPGRIAGGSNTSKSIQLTSTGLSRTMWGSSMAVKRSISGPLWSVRFSFSSQVC